MGGFESPVQTTSYLSRMVASHSRSFVCFQLKKSSGPESPIFL